MPQQLSPYIRGALFCIFAGPAIPAAAGALLFGLPRTLLETGWIFLGVVAFGLFFFALPIAACASLMVRNALRAAKRGDSMKSIKTMSASMGWRYGGLIGLCFPFLLFSVSGLLESWSVFDRSNPIGELAFTLFAVFVVGLCFAVPAAASGLVIGYFMPSVLGPAFRQVFKGGAI